MKRRSLKIFIGLIVLMLITVGCTKDESKPLAKPSITEAPSDVAVVSDTTLWEHPVKKVLKDNNIKISKLELLKNKTYPKFYVEFTKPVSSDTVVYYKKVLNEIASANGYWDYSIIDSKNKINIEVTCDKAYKSVKTMVVNGDDILMNSESLKEKSGEAIEYLRKMVPEIGQFSDELEKSSNGSIHLLYRIDNEPDRQSGNEMEKNYYTIYVGENHPENTVRWNSFYVKGDLSEILIDDYETGKPITLEKWREQKQLSQKILDYFISQVPEINSINTTVDIKTLIEIGTTLETAGRGDSEKRYYRVRLKLDHVVDTFYWDWFYVNKNFNQIVVEDNVNWTNEKILSLSAWRKQIPDSSLISFIRSKGINSNKFSYIVCDDIDLDGNKEYVAMIKTDEALVIKNSNGTFSELGTIKPDASVDKHLDGIHIVRLDNSPKKYILIDLSNGMKGLGFTLYGMKGSKIYNVDENFPSASGEGTRTLEDTNGDGIYERVDYDQSGDHTGKTCEIMIQYYKWNGKSFAPDRKEVKIEFND